MDTKKTFELLTDEELISLSQEEIDWYIKLKKAETGIRIVSCPVMPELRAIPEPDMALYEVCGFSFIERESAEKISSLINEQAKNAYSVNYDWSVGSEYQYAKKFSGKLNDVNLKNAFSEETYNSIREILVSNQKIMSSYKKVKDEYDEMERLSSEIVEKIYGGISSANGRKIKFEEYILRIQEYLRLSNGDTEIAWNFFEKAYAIEPSVKNKILSNEEYINAVAGY